MRAVVQRCTKGKVSVEGEVVGSVDSGYVVLIGVRKEDSDQDAQYVADKIAYLRVFEDADGKMNRGIIEAGGAILAISQFTLYGDTRGARRPSFTAAAGQEEGLRLFDAVVARLRGHGLTVETGVFGAHMMVEIENDGPVTILIDSQKAF